MPCRLSKHPDSRMPPASLETFVPLFEANGDQPAARPVRLRLGSADLPVRSLREWSNSGQALGSAPAEEASSAASSLPASTGESSAPTCSPAAPARPTEPMLTVCRDGGRVVGLQIRCRCGEVIHLVCAYEEGPPQQSAAPPTAPIAGGA